MTDEPISVTVLVCVNRRLRHDAPSCAARGGEAIAAALEKAATGTPVCVTRLKCFGRCAEGPNVRILGGRFFRGTTLDDVPAVMEAALAGWSDASDASGSDQLN